MSDLPHTIVLVVGILCLAKAIWCIASPASFQRMTRFWMERVAQAGVLVGILTLAIALALWSSILLYRPVAEWIVGGLGLFYFIVALMLFKYRQYRRVFEALAGQDSVVKTRLIGILLLVGAAVAIWVAWEDM